MIIELKKCCDTEKGHSAQYVHAGKERAHQLTHMVQHKGCSPAGYRSSSPDPSIVSMAREYPIETQMGYRVNV